MKVKSLLFGTVATVIIVGLSGCASTEAKLQEKGLSSLSGNDIKQAINGNTLVGKTFDGYSFTTKYTTNGKMSAKGSGGSDTGKWSVESDKFCMQWSKWRKGVKNCHSVYQDGTTFYSVKSSGSLESTFSIK